MNDSTSNGPMMPPSAPRVRDDVATGVLRAACIALIVFGIEWRMADPYVIASHPQLWPLPWSMLFMMLPVALGAWAFQVTSEGRPGFKVDLLRGVLAGTLAYVIANAVIRYL